MDFTVTNVTSNSDLMFKQEYSLEYVRSGDANNADAVSEGNTVLRGRSGNPGYLMGKPLLNGMKYPHNGESSYAMLSVIPGLQVYDASNSVECVDSGSSTTTVNFGEDLISGCILKLSYANFTDMCESGKSL